MHTLHTPAHLHKSAASACSRPHVHTLHTPLRGVHVHVQAEHRLHPLNGHSGRKHHAPAADPAPPVGAAHSPGAHRATTNRFVIRHSARLSSNHRYLRAPSNGSLTAGDSCSVTRTEACHAQFAELIILEIPR
jgi:hypothetical protein